MNSFLTDCTSSVEPIRQQAAGSLVEQRAHFWRGGKSSSLLFVKALSHRDQVMTALLNLWMVFHLKQRTRFVSGCDFFFNHIIRKTAKCKMGQSTWGGAGVLKFWWVLVSCSAGLYSSTLTGARRGKGNRRFMSSCDTRCSGSHVNGKRDV